MCVEWRCTVDGVVELAKGRVVPSRRVGSKAREVAEIVGALVLPMQGYHVAKALTDERVSERIVEETAWFVPVDRIKERIAEQSADVLMSQMRPVIVKVIQPVLVVCINDRAAGQMDIQLPPVIQEIAAVVQEVAKLVPRERV